MCLKILLRNLEKGLTWYLNHKSQISMHTNWQNKEYKQATLTLVL